MCPGLQSQSPLEIWLDHGPPPLSLDLFPDHSICHFLGAAVRLALGSHKGVDVGFVFAHPQSICQAFPEQLEDPY